MKPVIHAALGAFFGMVVAAFAGAVFEDSVIATGQTGSDGIGRSDAQFEATNNGESRHALIAITNDINPGDTTEEAAISYQARNSSGAMQQMASVSAMWPCSASSTTGFASLRLNVDDTNGGSEIFLRGFGRSLGVTFYGADECDYPGIPAVQFNRQSGNPSITGKTDLVIEGAPASAGTVFLNAYHSGDVWSGLGGGTTIVDRLRLRVSSPPASSSAACTAGDMQWDAGYVYVCIGTNTWRRAALATF